LKERVTDLQVAGNSAGLSAKWMNNASVLYLVARILFCE